MDTYNKATVTPELAHLKDWKFEKNALEKHFEFKDFIKALGFIIQVGFIAEKKNHHPELFNVYNKVTLRLNTHTENAVTTKDIDLALAIDKL